MNLIGQEKNQEFLKKSIQSGYLSHAYIFFGPPQVGKKALVEWFAKQLMCQSQKGRPCEQCPSCMQLAQKIHPDVITVSKEEEKKDISVKQIRSMISFLQSSSFYQGYKIGIVYDAQYLNVQASNALLKTLEEPAQKTIIILTTSSKEELLHTIISRCHTLYCAPVKTETIYDEVLRVTQNHDQAKLVSRISLGRPQLMQILVDQPEILQQIMQEVQVWIDILNTSDISEKFKYLQAVITGKELLQIKKEAIRLCDHWLLVLFDLMFIHLQRSDALCYGTFEQKLRQISTRYSLQECQQLASHLLETKQTLHTNVNARYILENYLLNTK